MEIPTFNLKDIIGIIFKRLSLHLLLIVVFIFFMEKNQAQSDSTHLRILKLDFRSIILLSNPNNATKTLRFDYQYFKKKNQAVSFGLQVGDFNRYTYIKYYDYFGNFNYNREDVNVRGFHFYSSYDFFPLRKLRFFMRNFSISPALDMNFYNKHKEIYISKTNSSTTENFNSFQFSSGITIAYRQKIWRNISLDALMDSQFKVFSLNSSAATTQVPLNGFSLKYNQKINLNYCIRIGYEF